VNGLKYSSYTETEIGGMHRYLFTTVPCPMCQKTGLVSIEGQALFRYHQGASPQEAFPNLSASVRERLFITGICGPCWDAMYCTHDDDCEVHSVSCPVSPTVTVDGPSAGDIR
jgi:hypothetical protein